MPDDTPSRHVPRQVACDSPQVGSAGVPLVRSDGLPLGKIAGNAVSPTKNGDHMGPMTGNGKHTTYRNGDLWLFYPNFLFYNVLYHLLVIREMASCCLIPSKNPMKFAVFHSYERLTNWMATN